jgi:hypothetical protein
MTEESMRSESQRQEPERHLAEVLRLLRGNLPKVDRKRGRVKLRYSGFDWALNRG